jgi:hypothetical protein
VITIPGLPLQPVASDLMQPFLPVLQAARAARSPDQRAAEILARRDHLVRQFAGPVTRREYA